MLMVILNISIFFAQRLAGFVFFFVLWNRTITETKNIDVGYGWSASQTTENHLSGLFYTGIGARCGYVRRKTTVCVFGPRAIKAKNSPFWLAGGSKCHVACVEIVIVTAAGQSTNNTRDQSELSILSMNCVYMI